MRMLRPVLLLAGLALVAAGPAAAIDLVPHSLFPSPMVTFTLLEVATGVPAAGDNTGCPIDVVPCVGASDLTFVLEASNASAGTIDSIAFTNLLQPAPANMTGVGRIPGTSEPDGLADVEALWGGLLPGDPRVLFPDGLAPGQTSNRFFLSFEAGTGPGTLLPTLVDGTYSELGLFEIVPEPPLAAIGVLAGLALLPRRSGSACAQAGARARVAARRS